MSYHATATWAPIALKLQTTPRNGPCCMVQLTDLWARSVSVMPCDETLKWTMVVLTASGEDRTMSTVLVMASGPVRLSVSNEHTYNTLQAGNIQQRSFSDSSHVMSLASIILFYFSQHECMFLRLTFDPIWFISFVFYVTKFLYVTRVCTCFSFLRTFYVRVHK